MFDIALLPRPELDALVAAGKIAAGSYSRHDALGGRARGARRRAKPDIAHRRGVQARAAAGAIDRL